MPSGSDTNNKGSLEGDATESSSFDLGLVEVLHASSNGMMITDNTGKILFINQKGTLKLGMSAEQIVGKFLSRDLLISERPFAEDMTINSRVHSESIAHFNALLDLPALNKETLSHLEVSVAKIKAAHGHNYVVSCRDMTREKLIEKELERQKKFTEEILNNLPADIAVFDPEHKYLFVNPYAIRDEKIRSWIIGKTDRDYFEMKGKSPDLADVRHEYFKESLKTGNRVQWVDTIPNAAGNRYTLRNFYPYLENSQVKYVFGYGIDVTEMRETQNKLHETLESLESMNSELQHIAYIISHDLQEPLRMVKSFLQLLEKRIGEKLDETEKKYIEFAQAGADRMKRHIIALLEFSRIGNKKEELQPSDLMEIIREIELIFQLKISETNTILKYPQLPTIVGFKEGLFHLLQNLIENAIKYRDPDKELNCIEIGFIEDEDNWLFFIDDNGKGIEAQYFEKIFQLFQRLDNDRSETAGSGIGLAICKKIIELHHGKMWVESEPGKGTRFHISIPKNLA
jgi:PAS domain S-box-containing protein